MRRGLNYDLKKSSPERQFRHATAEDFLLAEIGLLFHTQSKNKTWKNRSNRNVLTRPEQFNNGPNSFYINYNDGPIIFTAHYIIFLSKPI